MAEVPPVESLLEHAAYARRLARALVGDAARADDVVQTSWLQALQHPPRPGHGLRSWFGTVVRNAAARVRREDARRDERERRAAVPERLPSTADVAAQLSAQRALLEAVARLDEPYRATIHARFFEERTPTEIAAASGIPVRTVETRLRRAIARLREALDAGFEGGSAAWAGLLLGGGVVATSSKPVAVAVAAVVAIAVVATPFIVMSSGERRASEGGAPIVSSADAKAPPLVAKAGDAAAVTPESAAAAAPSAARESARCTVAVVTPEGAPIAGADLVLFRGEEVIADAATNASGEATLPREEAASRLLVAPGCAPMLVVDVAAASSAIEVALEGGAVCSGSVSVDGKSPEGPIELQFDGAVANRVEVPDAVWKRLQKRGSKNIRGTRATTDRDGGFVAFGFAAHEKLTILVPAPYETAATRETWLHLDEAREGLEIALRFNPTIRGRVLARNGEPLARWRVEAWLVYSGGAGSEEVATTEDDGRFRVPLHNHRGEERSRSSAVVYVSDPSGLFVSRVAVDPPIGEGGDLGDVVVDTARMLAVEARDPDGRALDEFAVILTRRIHEGDLSGHPWKGAVVPEKRARSGFYVPVEVASLRAVAPGCFAADVPIEPATGKATATLAPAASLSLSIRDGNGPLPQCTLEVSGAVWPAAWTGRELDAAHESLGGSKLTNENLSRPQPRSFKVWGSQEGSFRLLALVPATPLEVIVRDLLGVELLHETVQLAPGEARVLDRTVESRAFDVVGFVHSDDGKPVAARVEWSTRGADDGSLAWAKSDGRFRIEGVRAPHVSLLVQAAGFAWKWVEDVEPAKLDHPLDLELVRGTTVRVGFVGNRDGQETPSAVWIESVAERPHPDGADLPPADGARVDGKLQRCGYAFENAPEAGHWLRARIEGFTFAYDVPKGSSDHCINSMLRGPATVEWSVAHSQAGRTLKAIRLLPTGGFHHARAAAVVDAAAAERGSGSVRFAHLPIDRYTVTLAWDDGTEEATEATVDVTENATPTVRVAR